MALAVPIRPMKSVGLQPLGDDFERHQFSLAPIHGQTGSQQ
jgi:hypothetical protein